MSEATTLSVHRCRFVDFDPSAITALAFPPVRLPSRKGKRPETAAQVLKFGTLAVGHANGNIDLCEWTGEAGQRQSSQAWVVRKTLPGLYPSKVDSIAFAIRDLEKVVPDEFPTVENLRLFTSGGGSELLEWDISKGCIRRTINSQGGSIWSIAVNHTSTLMALGCEDGSIRILSLQDDTLVHRRRFDRVKARILSIAWGPPSAVGTETENQKALDEVEWSDSWIVTGGSDNSIRKWDFATGRVLDRMATDKIRGERTLVWSVAVLGNGTIVSGDSMGMVKFWDSRTCTQVHSFQGHGADVLCLTVGSDGMSLYSAGVDQKVTQYSLIKSAEASNENATRMSARWVQSASRRLHSHDIRAIAIWPPYTPLPPAYQPSQLIDIAPILFSGGLDMSIVTTPAALPSSTVVKITNPLVTSVETTFADSYHRRLAYNSGPSSTSSLKLARRARIISCMRDSSVSMWRIFKQRSSKDEFLDEGVEPDDQDSGGWEKILDIELAVKTNLVASQISDDGEWFAVSDLYESRLFRLETSASGHVKPRRIKDFAQILQSSLPAKLSSCGGIAFAFTSDSSKLIMSTALSPYIVIVDVNTKDQKPKVLRYFDHHCRSAASRTTRGKVVDNEDVLMQDGDASDSDDEDSGSVAHVVRLAISIDGQWLASSDDFGRTHVFNLDSIQHHCVLPSFPLPTQAISFDPAQPNLLILTFPNNTLQIYDVESRQFPPWFRDFKEPKALTTAHEPILGVVFDRSMGTPSTSEPERDVEMDTEGSSRQRGHQGTCTVLWGSTWLSRIHLDGSSYRQSWKKRARNGHQASSTDEGVPFKLVTKYRPILFVDFLGPYELVVIERPLVDVLANLPPAYYRPKYGMS